MVRLPDQTPVGPESFAVAPDGNVLIGDLVNGRILVCAPDGTLLRSIEFPGVRLNDVFADASGNVFAYDQAGHKLYQADSSGAIKSAVELTPAKIDTRGYFHSSGDSIYFADAGARDVLVATIKEGTLVPPAEDAEYRFDGIHGRSGKLYTVNSTKGESVYISSGETGSETFSYSLQLPFGDILSARFAGEDTDGKCYIALERWNGSRVMLEVRAFGPKGEQLGAVALPENDYAIWTSKLVEAAPDGHLFQFIPGEEDARLNLITMPSKESINQ